MTNRLLHLSTALAMTVAGLAHAQAPLAPQLPVLREGESLGAGAYVAWILVMGLALAGVWLVRRVKGGKMSWPAGLGTEAPNSVKIVSSKMLSQHARLHVVEWEGKQYLLCVTSTGTAVVDSREPKGVA